jgi:F-type H+-transporting ATPase subunit delta
MAPDFVVLTRFKPRQRPGDATISHIRPDCERMDVSETASISTGIAQRYATAVYDLAQETNKVQDIEGDIDALRAALDESDDFRTLIQSPIYSRDEQRQAITALAAKMGLSDIMSNTLALMASKRRLFVLPALLRALRERIAEEKGQITAEVTSAKALTKTQSDKLAKTLKANTGKDITLHTTVDENLIGGLIVKVGSKMIDTSIRSKLNSLQNAMKEVG